MFVCLCVWNSWGHNADNVEMTEISLHREWVLELSKCVYVKFDQMDFSASQDIAKNQIFFSQIGRLIRREGLDLERAERGGERFNC